MFRHFIPLACLALLPLAACQAPQKTGSVIFIHPDGTSAAHFTATRNLYVGPDNDLHWDKLPHVAVYREHMSDSLTATSNGGATVHAYGIKVPARSFGLHGETPITDAQGRSTSVMQQAIRRGIPVGVVNSGTSTEPGTACFLTSVVDRENHQEIAQQLVASGATVILGGGETWFIPAGTQGRHGRGSRTDGRNLLDEARKAGYAVIFTRDELLNLPSGTRKVLGVFAVHHTFLDHAEEELASVGLEPYIAEAPTIAEMTAVAIKVLSASGRPFFLMTEEEGTDNFGNVNNAAGSLLANKRADDAIGVARDYLKRHPSTLIMVTADSNAGGMAVLGLNPKNGPVEKLPPRDANGAPIDGIAGAGTAPFVAMPDRTGTRLPFAITWATLTDVSGGVLVRAEGLNAQRVRGSFDNTKVAELIRLTLFGDHQP